MEKLEKRIIEIRENINFLNQEMNEMYSAYEIAKDKKEDAEVNLEILNNQKKEISSKILSKQVSKVSFVLVPLIFSFLLNFLYFKIEFSKITIINAILLFSSIVFLVIILGALISFVIVKILNRIVSSDVLFISIDKDIRKYKKEERSLQRKINSATKILSEYKSIEKEYVSKYSELCTKYNSSKQKLDEIENTYFNKTKNILNDLKTYNIYSILNSLSIEDREYILQSIKNNFLNYQK